MADGLQQRLIGLSLHFGSGDADVNTRLPSHTPPSTTRRLDQPASTGEQKFEGLDCDQIAKRCFESIQFNSNQTTVLDNRCYYHLAPTDEQIRLTLFRLFGVRLSVSELESNIDSLELNKWGWQDGTQTMDLDLSRRIAHAKIAELALLACSSLSPMMVESVGTVLSSLADSLQSMSAVLSKHTIDCNLFSTDPQGQAVYLVNSRFSTQQTSSKWMVLCCGFSHNHLLLSLQIRKVGFTRDFVDLIRQDSPIVRRRIHGVNLLPPSPEFTTRAMTAPSSVPIRPSSRATPRLQQVQMEALGLRSLQPSREVSPLSVIRQLEAKQALAAEAPTNTTAL